MAEKIKALSKKLQNPILIKKKENLFYLTGRTIDNRADEYLLLTKNRAVAFGGGLENIAWIKNSDRLKNIGKYLKGYKQLDIEYGFTYGEGEYLKRVTSKKVTSDKKNQIKIEPQRSVVDIMRQVKTKEEIELVRKSMQIVEKVFLEVRKRLGSAGHPTSPRLRRTSRPATTEIQLAQFIQKKGLQLGAQDLSFPAIVASGSNAAIPHHVPGNKKLVAGEPIILDFGFKYKNYCSDFTRTVFIKKVGNKKIEEAYNQVEKAYLGSIDFCNLVQATGLLPNKAGRLVRRSLGEVGWPALYAGDVYQKAVDILAEKKLDKYFIHSLGHGTGLEIHELPNLSPKSKDILQNGMVFSIEPGVYIPKLGGVRIEDLVYLPPDSFHQKATNIIKKTTFDNTNKIGYNNKKNLVGEKLNKVEKFINIPTELKFNIL